MCLCTNEAQVTLARFRRGPNVAELARMDVTSSGFNRFATRIARAAGNSSTFGLASLVIVGWAVTGPLFRFSDTWQLVINTSTTIVTFLMVFLIQNTQNRDSAATQLKLDEIIRATVGAHNAFLDVEQRGDKELAVQREQFNKLARQARVDVATGSPDTGETQAARSPTG